MACIKSRVEYRYNMTRNLFILFISIIVLISCQSVGDSQKNSMGLDNRNYYLEKKLSFFDPYEITYANGRFQGYTYETWIRQPEHLKMLHETFKKIGYKKLFSKFNYSEDCGFIHDVWKPCDELIDSLILTYKTDKIESKYYREFWNRRINEKNDSIVFKILKEVSYNVYLDSIISYDEKLVNDTLLRLIEIRDFDDSLTIKKAQENFEYLKSIGLHGSAYNLLYERYKYYEIEWNQEELKQGLKTDTINCCPWTFIEDDTK